jgi:hypothetical protein
MVGLAFSVILLLMLRRLLRLSQRRFRGSI